jgi:glycosyltransferase involved in cell wall biosynthesis
MAKQINYSFVIPHHNTPELLQRLIDSIPQRDDIEIIVVDDNSDDDKKANITRSDVRTIYIDKDHTKGAGRARNVGMDAAKGKWLLFADSDDFFNDGFNDFLDKYKDSDADIVYFNANSVDTDTYEVSNRADHLHEFHEIYQKDKVRGELIMRCMFTEPWCKMIKRDLINKYSIRFDTTAIHEDVKFACLVGRYAKKVLVDNRQLYCVTSRADSLSRTQSHQAYLDELLVFSKWKRFLMNNYPSMDLAKFDYRVYNFARHLYKDNILFKEEYHVLRETGFSHVYIIGQILKYLWKSVRYKLKF